MKKSLMGLRERLCSRAELTPPRLITNHVCRIHDRKSKENRGHGWKEAFLECVWKWKMDGGMGVQGEWPTLPYLKWTVNETGDVSKQQEMFLCRKALHGKGENDTWSKWKMGLKVKIFKSQTMDDILILPDRNSFPICGKPRHWCPGDPRETNLDTSDSGPQGC